MRIAWVGPVAIPLFACAGILGEVAGTCEQGVEAAVQPGSAVRMNLRAGDIAIAGTNRSVLRVVCDLSYSSKAKNVAIRYDSGELRISGGPKDRVRFKIEVPSHTNLILRAPSGDVTISGVAGDKDIGLRSGDVTIDAGDPADYKQLDVSVRAGNISATAFGVDRDGLFKSLKKNNSAGKYSLRLRLFTGDVTIR